MRRKTSSFDVWTVGLALHAAVLPHGTWAPDGMRSLPLPSGPCLPQVLMTRAMRERLRGPAGPPPSSATIRVKFPEGISLQVGGLVWCRSSDFTARSGTASGREPS